jgi:hypothetical protein
MTPEERRKRMEERMAAMTPEERAAFQERMAQRAAQGGDRGGAGAQGQGRDRQGLGGGQDQGGGRGGPGSAQPGNTSRQSANAQGSTRTAPMGRVASTPSMTGTATTIDSLFGPLPTVESRGSAWLWENKLIKQVRLRLGVTDGTNIEILEAPPEVHEGTEVVTNVILEQPTTTPAGANANNPLMGPQRGRPGGPGGPGGGGGGGGRGGR